MPLVVRSSILISISILLVGPSIFGRFPLLLFLSLTTLVCPDPTPVWIRVPLRLAAVSAPPPIRGKKPVCSQQPNREKNARNTEQGLLHHEESPLLLVNRARGVPTACSYSNLRGPASAYCGTSLPPTEGGLASARAGAGHSGSNPGHATNRNRALLAHGKPPGRPGERQLSSLPRGWFQPRRDFPQSGMPAPALSSSIYHFVSLLLPPSINQ